MPDPAKTFKDELFGPQALASLLRVAIGALVAVATVSFTLGTKITHVGDEVSRFGADLKANMEQTSKLQADMIDAQKQQKQNEYSIQKAVSDNANLQKIVEELKTNSAKQWEDLKNAQKEQWKLGTETSSDVKVLLERTKDLKK